MGAAHMKAGSVRTLTLRRRADVALNPTTLLALRARLAWAHDSVSDPALAPVFQALPGASFIVNGVAPATNSALASAGAELRLANGVSLSGSSMASSPRIPRPMPEPAPFATPAKAALRARRYFRTMACCGVALGAAGEIWNVSHTFQSSGRCAALNSL